MSGWFRAFLEEMGFPKKERVDPTLFLNDVESILRAGGWFPGRRVPVTGKWGACPPGHPGTAVLEEYGEPDYVRGAVWLAIYEDLVPHESDYIPRAEALLGTTLVCVGMHYGMDYILIASDGAVFVEEGNICYYWADSFQDYLERRLFSGKPAAPPERYPAEFSME